MPRTQIDESPGNTVHDKNLLRLLSWNVCDANKDKARVLRCIQSTEPDLVVLQEALPQHIDVLRSVFSEIIVGRDCVQGHTKSYIVFATNLTVRNASVISHFDLPKLRPSILAKMSNLDQFLDSLLVEITTRSGNSLQLAAIHTSAYASPSVRAREVASVIDNLAAKGPCLIAGDFNCFAHPAFSWIVAPFLGFRASDLVVREVRHLSAALAAEGFSMLDPGVTYPRLKFSLDHVFARSVKIEKINALAKTWGSDHRPVLVDFTEPL